MYQVGDFIIYGNNGVCKVTAVGTLPKLGMERDKQYYTLLPLYNNQTIYTPVDTKVFMRPVITKQQAQELIREIPQINEDIIADRNRNDLSEKYRDLMRSHDCKDLIQLIKAVYVKNKKTEESGKKLGQVDINYRRKAEELLYGELAVALDIPRENVLDYIDETIKMVS